MMELVTIARHEGNPDLPYRILITLFDRYNQTHHGIKNQLNYTFAGGVFRTMIEADDEIYKTAILGFPSKTTHGVKQYRALVDELLQEIKWNWG
jgi:cellulose biosynthesis protein BcsQ